MSLTTELIACIRAREYSREDLDAAALFSLDALACAYAGCNTPVGHILRDWSRQEPLDYRRQAWLIAALCHITETDDLHRASVTHPGCVVVPAALSLGERIGANGVDILKAILQGYEAMCRIGAAVGPAHYRIWHNTATCGPFGAAMAAAALLKLDAEQTAYALGNAGTQSSGFWQFMEDGAMSKHLHAGHASESGLLAADLAVRGFTGPTQILEGGKGFFAGMCDDPQPHRILENPDADWQLRLTSIKPWPSCRHTHPVIDCALEIHAGLAGATAQAIEVKTYQAALDVCDNPEPDSEYQAKFSLYHTAAIALLDGRVTLQSFTPEARARCASLRDRVSVTAADPYASDYPVAWGAEVQVSTADGGRLRASRQHCKGDPELALDAGEMRAKALGLLDYGGLDDRGASEFCDRLLAMPDAGNSASTVTRQFLEHALKA